MQSERAGAQTWRVLRGTRCPIRQFFGPGPENISASGLRIRYRQTLQADGGAARSARAGVQKAGPCLDMTDTDKEVAVQTNIFNCYQSLSDQRVRAASLCLEHTCSSDESSRREQQLWLRKEATKPRRSGGATREGRGRRIYIEQASESSIQAFRFC